MFFSTPASSTWPLALSTFFRSPLRTWN